RAEPRDRPGDLRPPGVLRPARRSAPGAAFRDCAWRPAPSPVTGLAICARLAICDPRGDPRPARRSATRAAFRDPTRRPAPRARPARCPAPHGP
ncbi:hypothetical protein ACFY48_27840, partial [Streptomyces coeruleorubidus]